MMGLQEEIETSIGELRRLTKADFVGFASVDSPGQKIQWKYVSGNITRKYERIVIRNGKGIAGEVIRCGRPIILQSFLPRNGSELCDNTLLVAERLRSILCVPIITEDQVLGVLLVAFRNPFAFDKDQIELVLCWAEQIGAMMGLSH